MGIDFYDNVETRVDKISVNEVVTYMLEVF